MARYDHIDFKPPQGAREAAKRALEVRAEKPESERGMTPVGIARARDLANGKTLSPETVRRMKAYFDRHESDKSGETWDSQGKGWQAWQGWGGDAGRAWASKVVRQMEAADAADKRMSDDARREDDPGVAIVLPIDEETAEYALPGVADAHVTLAYLGRTSALPMGAVDLARAVVSRWASQTPPMPAAFSGVGRFLDAEDGADAAYLSVDAPGLSAARDALCRELRAAGLAVSSSHGFTPHATLAYLPREAATPAAPCDLPLALALDTAAVWCGAEHGAPYALTGSGDPAMMNDNSEPLAGTGEGVALDGVTYGIEGLPIAFADGAQASVGHSTWNQIARLGRYAGHPQGAVEFTPAVFEDILRNFAAHGNGEIPLDFEHMSERLPASTATHGVPAPGWVTKVEVRNGGRELWALFRWVDAKAVGYVRAGQYRYVSPAVNFKARDKATGKPVGAKLTSVALTNHPFLEGMKPLAADDRNAALDALIAQVAAALGTPEGEVRAKLLPRIAPDTAEGAVMAPAADSLHTPTTGSAPAEKPPMNPDETAEMAGGAATIAAADPQKMQPAAAPAAVAGDPAKDKAEKEAADASGEKRDATGKFATMRRMAEACGMRAFDETAEGAEDALIAHIGAMVAELAKHQEAEKAAIAAQAAAMSDRVIAAGRAPATAREKLVALCLSDRETFDALHPLADVEAAEKRDADAEAVKLSQRSDDRRDAATLLASRLASAGTTHATANAATTPEAETLFSARRDARAAEIVKRDGVDIFTATERADRELRAAH